MDTFSHVVIGFGIAALAQIDPAVSANDTLLQAVLFGTVIGSNAPDFDFLYRLKGKGNYLRNHRGLSLSLPALPLWGILVSGMLYPFFTSTSFFHLFLWTFLAVILHVFLDLFNVHGTQIFRPYSREWIAIDAVPITKSLENDGEKLNKIINCQRNFINANAAEDILQFILKVGEPYYEEAQVNLS